MGKPTSLAAQLQRDDQATKLAEEKEDAEVIQRPNAEGKVWVRLLRPHYDSNGVMHLPGIAELEAIYVPSSAKVLSAKEAIEAATETFEPPPKVIAPIDSED